MKNSFLLLFIAFIANFGFAQAPPQGINYQAVVYSDNGENEPGLNVPGQVLRNKNIRVRFTIIQNATNGTEVYKESHTKTTDAFGMFSLVIGAGTPQGSSTFSNINWGAGLHFLKVEIDKRGGTNYVTMSNQQLLSVPYALYSDKSTYATSAGNGITSVSDNGNGSLTFTYTDGSTYTTPILTGLQGPQGIQGATGAQGPAGQNGTNGVNGTDGINGTNGANGQNGLSSYEIWLTQGNTGTENDFLTAITGAQGPQGIPGQNGTNGVNGTDGINGTNGANGQNGLSAYEIWLAQGNTGTESDFLTAITGPTGAQGAQGIQGVAGPTGATGLQGPIGLTGPTGPTGATGAQGIQGATGAAGTNGTNGTNGLDGKNTLAKTTTEAAGANCTTGGVKIEYGLDANNNGTLDVSEINATLTKYVCNGTTGATGAQGPIGLTGPTGATGATGAQGIQGIQGATGAAGTNGADGKNTLAKTTNEAAGANCTTGGVKVEYGLDANNNGTLDVSEVNATLTKYLCNGDVGATGATGADGRSINWLGELNNSPLSPNINDAYFDVTDNIAYLWNGSSWTLMFRDNDNNPTNEIQQINVTSDSLKIEGANSVPLSSLIPSNISGFHWQIFTSSGNFIVPEGVTSLLIEIIGAGGGGARYSSNTADGGAGGSGAYGKTIVAVTPGQIIPVTIGAGGLRYSGTSSSGGNGFSGGNTSFGTFVTATGGFGGQNTSSGGVAGTCNTPIVISGRSCSNNSSGCPPNFYYNNFGFGGRGAGVSDGTPGNGTSGVIIVQW